MVVTGHLQEAKILNVKSVLHMQLEVGGNCVEPVSKNLRSSCVENIAIRCQTFRNTIANRG